jgi:hypothetical protein
VCLTFTSVFWVPWVLFHGLIHKETPLPVQKKGY